MPVANENRGNDRLDEARRVAIEYESVIGAKDRAAIEDRITYAREMKVGLDSKWGISKILQAREYRLAATDALRFTKAITDRPRISPWGGDAVPDRPEMYTGPSGPNQISTGICDDHHHSCIPAGDPAFTGVIGIAQHLYRCYLSCRNAFPTPKKRAEWAEIVWCEASVRAGAYPGPSFQAERFTVSSMAFLAGMRAKIRDIVETSYGFDASPSTESKRDNANHAWQLLTNMAFMYRDHNSPDDLRNPYQHPVIQGAINVLWFKNKEDDGMTFQEHFSPLPIEAMALVLTLIQCSIDEWTDGTRKGSTWDERHFKTLYQSHIGSLTELHDNDNVESDDSLEAIRCDLLKNASDHADSANTRKAPDVAQQEGLPAYADINKRSIEFEDDRLVHY